MERIYLDNAATTQMADEVLEAMMPYLSNNYGNPSSIHAHGRQSKAGIVTSRKTIAKLLNCGQNEIIFTSGGTEADNMAINCAVRDLGVRHIITSPIEHKAVIQTSMFLQDIGNIKVSLVNLEPSGCVDYDHLESLLADSKEKTLVSLMHANNEIGCITDIQKVGEMCRKYDALFHSDTVQTMAHYHFDFTALPVDFMTCSAHKFHGPKGNGFLYIKKNVQLKAMIMGGGQERSLRAGTENVAGIVGLAKALESAYEHLDEHASHISSLKQYMRQQLEAHIPEVKFNGDPSENGLYTVLSVSFPDCSIKDMFLFSLDIQGISASGGSACSSGSDIGSHVLNALGVDPSRLNVRFSFGRYNTKEEIDRTISVLKSLLSVN